MVHTDSISAEEYNVHLGNAPWRLTVQVPLSWPLGASTRLFSAGVVAELEKIDGVHEWASGQGFGYRDHEFDILNVDARDQALAKAQEMLAAQGYTVAVLGPEAGPNDEDEPTPDTAILAWAANIPDPEDATDA